MFDRATAERVVEQLRYGVPPPEHVRAFTIGREAQLQELERSLEQTNAATGAALLVKANYGSGKSHLLKVVREIALRSGYAVSLVVVNTQEGVRFNRMDTIFGAICHELEIAGQKQKGVGALFDAFAGVSSAQLTQDIQRVRDRISRSGHWDNSDYLKSPAIYVALRAWVRAGGQPVRELVQDWLSHPENYRGQRKRLYCGLIEELRHAFRDPRREWQYYAEEVFSFHASGHRQAWDALADLHLLALASGLKGLILLVDEFEDVIQNLNRRDLQEQAFLNLFRFFDGDRFPGMSYFAVTPDFVAKCKNELLRRGVYDFDYTRFELLQSFEMEAIQPSQFLELADRIRKIYGLAYNVDAIDLISDADLKRAAEQVWTVRSPDRVRRSIQAVIKALDDRLERVA